MITLGSRFLGAGLKPSSFARLEYRGGVLTTQPAGPQIAEREATIISRKLNKAFAATGKRMKAFLLDLTNVQTVSGMGLGMCIDAHKRARDLGARTIVIGLSPQLEELFRVMKVDRMYKIARTKSELSGLLAA